MIRRPQVRPELRPVQRTETEEATMLYNNGITEFARAGGYVSDTPLAPWEAYDLVREEVLYVATSSEAMRQPPRSFPAWLGVVMLDTKPDGKYWKPDEHGLSETHLYVSQLVLAPECIGKKVGESIIVPLIEQKARKFGATTLRAIHRNTAGLEDIYTALGFDAVDEVGEGITVPGGTVVKREKHLR